MLTIEDLLEAPDASQARLLLALDGVEDPQNLGALLRVADGAGVDGVVVTERRSAPLSPVAVKASAGAVEHLRIARVVNLVRALEELKEQNIWVIGLDERGETDYDRFDLTGNCVLVLGREGRRAARPGEAHLRPSAADSDGGRGEFAECIDRGSGGAV